MCKCVEGEHVCSSMVALCEMIELLNVCIQSRDGLIGTTDDLIIWLFNTDFDP